MEASQGVSALLGAARHGRWRRVLRLLAAGSGPAGAAPAGAALLRAGGAGRCLGAAAAIHPHALRPLLVAALRLAPARPASLAAAGAARAPRPARAGRLHPRLAAAQRRPAGLLHPALRAQGTHISFSDPARKADTIFHLPTSTSLLYIQWILARPKLKHLCRVPFRLVKTSLFHCRFHGVADRHGNQYSF